MRPTTFIRSNLWVSTNNNIKGSPEHISKCIAIPFCKQTDFSVGLKEFNKKTSVYFNSLLPLQMKFVFNLDNYLNTFPCRRSKKLGSH